MHRAIYALLTCLLLSTGNTFAQTAVTFADQSPIIRGVNSRINYFNKEKKTVQIPNEVLPLLAGVMILNKKDPKSEQFEPALRAWMEKYAFLEEQVQRLINGNQKQMATKFLAEGNFPAVEKLLQTNSNYEALEQYFPASYQTTGKQSPIMVGDNSTVSYVVTKVIEYKLPESLTQNILDRVYAQDKKIESLNLRLSKREEVIDDWIVQYQKLEQQLRNSPDSISQKAWTFFRQGKLDEALGEIEKTQASGSSIGRISLLKANILLLKFDYLHYEQSYDEINRQFQIATLLDDKSTDALYGYAQFISEFAWDQAKKIETLEIANRKIPDDSIRLKFTIALQLSDAYVNLQRHLTAEQWLQNARKFALAMPDEVERGKSLFMMHIGFSRIYGPTNQLEQCVAHCDSALALAEQFPAIKNGQMRYWYIARLNRLTPQTYQPSTQKAALDQYMRELAQAEKDLTPSVGDQLFLIDRFSYMANQFATVNDWATAKRLLFDISARLRPYISPKGQLYFQMYFRNWLVLLNALSQNGNYVEWEKELLQMEEILGQLTQAMPPQSLSKNQSRLDYEFAIYLLAHKKHPEALEKFQKCLTFMIQNLAQSPEEFAEHTAKSIDNIGDCYGTMYRTAEGIRYLKSIVSDIERVQNLDDRNYTFAKIKVYRRIGALFQLEGKPDSARIYLRKALRDAENRLTAANDAFLYDFITLSFDLSNSFLNFDNNRAIEIMDEGRTKILHYMSINPGLRQRYLTDLAYITGYTAHIYSLARNYQKANELYPESQRLFAEIVNPSLPSSGMYASMMLEYCQFLNNVDYLFPTLGKKERAEAGRRKCIIASECLALWNRLPDSQMKMQSINQINHLLQSCR